MNNEHSFRIVAIVLFLLIAATGLYHRIRAERSGEKISRKEEGLFIMIALRFFGFSAWLGLMTYMIQPKWMYWSTFSIALRVRWLGTGLAILAIPLFHWMLRSLGTNITDTVVTRKESTLVTHGPYHWVRHPMYSITCLLFLGFTLHTANWFIGLTGIGTLVLLIIRTSTEEAKLIERFGEDYRDYMKETGRFLPRLFNREHKRR
jgi:protein-S-isoprenylcysteine O-methyltransferase Ste14